MDFSSSSEPSVQALLNQLINTALEGKQAQQPPRDYVGGSRLGVECLRALFYEYTNTPKDEGKDFPGKILRRFRMGHWCEEEVAYFLRGAGFDLRVAKSNGEQYGFAVAKGKIAGHIDGVLLSGPLQAFTYPALWENKVMNNKKWKECDSKGVRKSHPVYYYQMQTYCAYMQLPFWVFTAYNSDTSDILTQYGPADMEAAQWASDRGVQVITAQDAQALPRLTKDENDVRCKDWCAYYQRCWRKTA
jgi:hypothetical protein